MPQAHNSPPPSTTPLLEMFTFNLLTSTLTFLISLPRTEAFRGNYRKYRASMKQGIHRIYTLYISDRLARYRLIVESTFLYNSFKSDGRTQGEIYEPRSSLHFVFSQSIDNVEYLCQAANASLYLARSPTQQGFIFVW